MHFYPRPPRGGRPLPGRAYGLIYNISIHALREEGDGFSDFLLRIFYHFYPRPPRGGRQCSQSKRLGTKKFLSTPSARRATQCVINCVQLFKFLSTPSARRATAYALMGSALIVFLSTPSARRATVLSSSCRRRRSISIHALREEGDRSVVVMSAAQIDFYPRPPRGGRPQRCRRQRRR